MKNPNGLGSVYKQTGRRKPWIARAPGVISDKKLVRPLIGSFATRAEALNALRNYSPEDTPREEVTLNRLWYEWKATKAYTLLSKSTKDGYNAAFNKLAPLAQRRIANIRTGEFQKIIDDLEQEGKSYSSLHALKVLCGILEDYAVQNDIITRNYAKYIILPKNDAEEKLPFTDIEVQKIIKGAEQGIPYADWLLILCYTGWRIEEFLQLTTFSYNRTDGTLTGGLKTDAGKARLVPVHPIIRPYLDRMADTAELYIFYQLSRNSNGADAVQQKMSSNYFRRSIWTQTLERLGIEPLGRTPHSTRHTFVSKLQSAGAKKVYLQRLVGHASKDVTDKVYTHADVEDLRRTIELLTFSA